MSLTQVAIDKNRITAVALLIILVAGINAYRAMPRNEDPGFIIRTAMVQTFFPGASPERVEQLITDKLEEVIREMPELDFVASTSKAGVSIVNVNIKERYTDLRPIWDKLRRKIDDARGALPEGVRGPFVNDEFGDVFGTLIALTGDGFEYRELKDIADEVRDELLLVADVAKVENFGAQDERIFADYKNARLAEYGLSPLTLQRLLGERNIILPGGEVYSEYETIVLEPSGNFKTIEDLSDSLINVPASGGVVRLADLVDIYRGYVDPPTALARYKGRPALMLAVSLREGGNILDLGAAVREVIRRAREVYPIGIEFDVLVYQSDVVEKKIDDFTGNLLQAVGIVVLVMLVFLGLRTGLIVASLIPAAIVAAFLVMSVFDIGLDQMSLASLIIALGMLVDNAIVMSESIMVRMEKGAVAREAAIDSARELSYPLLTSSLTTAAAFLPIFLAESSTGEYTAPLFKVVTITLLCSWVMALTLIPLLCVWFLRVSPRPASNDPFAGRLYRFYRHLLGALVRRPWLTMSAVAIVFFVAMRGFAYVPNIFFPDNDRPTFTVDVDLPGGSPISRTDTIVAEVEAFMAGELMAGARPDGQGVVNWGSFIGEGAPRFVLSFNPEPPSPNYAVMVGNTSSIEAYNEVVGPALKRFFLANFPDVNATVRPLALGAPAWPPVSVRVSGRDTDKLFDIVDQIKSKLATIPGALQITDDWGPRSKKVIIEIDENRARFAGVSNQDVAISLQTFLSGLETTEFREGDKLIPIVLRSESDARVDPKAFSSLNVFAQATGSAVPLTQVAEPRLVWQPSKIIRRDALRTIAVESLTAPGSTAAQINEVLEPWLDEQQETWGFGYNWEFGGEAETSGKANASIGEKLPIAGLIILILLVAQFNSLRRPAIILVTIPLGLTGVVCGLLIARSYFGFMTLLGIISLAGIVINNAIVLLDRIRIEIDDNGMAPGRAVIEAAQQRLRPILLTTATTIGGMLPLWLGGGPMWEPMAITIIFGLLFATTLTLGVVPVLYTIAFRVRY